MVYKIFLKFGNSMHDIMWKTCMSSRKRDKISTGVLDLSDSVWIWRV